MENRNPLISIVVPTFNEQSHIESCLTSIFSQNYPKDKLQVIIVDNYSTDNTVAIAQNYPIELLKNKTKDAQYLKMLGLRRSRGEYFIFLDADNRLVGKNWFKKMLAPHKNEHIVGSFTDTIPDPLDTIVSQYFATYSFYASPLYSFFSSRVEDTIVKRNAHYFTCRYSLNKIPPTGSCLYKMSFLKKANIEQNKKFMELDVLVQLVEHGYTTFAYVPKVGLHHTHIEKVGQIFWKRKRNLERNYLHDLPRRKYTWIKTGTPIQTLLQLFIYTVYACTILGPFMANLPRAVQYRKPKFIILGPLITFVEFWAVILGVLSNASRSNLLHAILKT